jgi:hypothetical protein
MQYIDGWSVFVMVAWATGIWSTVLLYYTGRPASIKQDTINGSGLLAASPPLSFSSAFSSGSSTSSRHTPTSRLPSPSECVPPGSPASRAQYGVVASHHWIEPVGPGTDKVHFMQQREDPLLRSMYKRLRLRGWPVGICTRSMQRLRLDRPSCLCPHRDSTIGTVTLQAPARRLPNGAA